MKLLVDMNLSPAWCATLEAEGWDTVHWMVAGARSASDREIMAWARANQRVVLTHDLDFGAILAATQAIGPSVVQVRARDVRPASLAPLVVSVLRQPAIALESGAIVVVDAARARVRLLPLASS